ncbi:U-scoloptoxin(05)-Sm1a-like isoform X2 [Thrips palmi]|uniref:U-scoloptoxin(05)-Sm1a-like isoform X2 n=1 Tax=Thrips palmi TaxID=161013 RepID=A0A6P9ACW3_THRPL|nr:U-scoloptoxin(05)-Sm1a-like isoform X2 [Thrips palmi]
MIVLNRNSRYFALILVLIAFLNPASAIQCYQCESTDHDNPFQCNEFMPEDSELQPSSCDYVDNAQYCIKLVGRNRGVYGTSRQCSSVDLGNYCDYIKNQGDVMDYRSCVYTCSSDGCNAANGLTNPNAAVMLISVGAALLSALYLL